MKTSSSSRLRRRISNLQLKTAGRWVFASPERAAKLLSLLFFVVSCCHVASAQSVPSPPVTGLIEVKTWKTGDGKITEKVLKVSLRKEPQYEFDLDDPTDPEKHYKLRFIAGVEHTLRTPSLPCWRADFREVTKDKASGGNRVGFHLLSPEGPGVGDYFPREEWAAHFCPIEQQNEVLDGHFYPIKTERRFLIEGFLVSFKVAEYRYDEAGTRLKNLDLVVEFKNSAADQALLSERSAHAKSKSQLVPKN